MATAASAAKPIGPCTKRPVTASASMISGTNQDGKFCNRSSSGVLARSSARRAADGFGSPTSPAPPPPAPRRGRLRSVLPPGFDPSVRVRASRPATPVGREADGRRFLCDIDAAPLQSGLLLPLSHFTVTAEQFHATP